MYRSVNNGSYKMNIERTIEAEAEAHGSINVTIECHYGHPEGDPRVPYLIIATLEWSDGIGKTKTTLNLPIINNAPSDLQKPLTITEDFVTLFEYAEQKVRDDGFALPSEWTVPMDKTIRRYAALDYMYQKNMLHELGYTGISIRNVTGFSQTQINLIRAVNRLRNGGMEKSDAPGDEVKAHPSGTVDMGLGLALVPGHRDLQPEVDHIVPKTMGGSNAFSNALLISSALNNKKRAKLNVHVEILRVHNTRNAATQTSNNAFNRFKLPPPVHSSDIDAGLRKKVKGAVKGTMMEEEKEEDP
jgi:5-methylcytosine-specific restriction endonuclease McrA